MKVNVIAKESSGRQWVDSLLKQHASLDVAGYSFPSDYMPIRCYPKVRESDCLVIVARDRTCQETSVNGRGYNRGAAKGAFEHSDNIAAIMVVMRQYLDAGKPVWFFSYETALVYRQDYLNWFFRLLGVEPVTVATEWRDENAKYFKP